MKSYLIIFLALMVLLALTLGAHHWRWGLSASLAIAALKALLVAVYFMHLKVSSNIVRAVAVAGFIWLALMIGLTFNDYVTRTESEPVVEFKR